VSREVPTPLSTQKAWLIEVGSDSKTLLAVVASELYAGPHNIIAYWARLLRPKGYRVVAVLPTEPGNAAALLRDAGAEVVQEQISRIRRDPRLALRWLVRIVPEIVRLRRVVLEQRADVVVVMRSVDVVPAIAAKLARRPLVWHVLDSAPPAWLCLLAGVLIRRTASAIPVMTPRIAELHGILGSKKVRFIGPPSDARSFTPKLSRRRTPTTSVSKLQIGVVAQLTPMKAIENVIRAAPRVRERVPQAEFLIVGGITAGHEAYNAFLHAEVGRLGLDDVVTFLGSRTDLPEVFAELDLLVIPSKNRSEGLPTVLLNAMMAKTPIVTTCVGGVPDVITDGVNALMVPPDDVAALARAIVDALANPETTRARAQRAFEDATMRFGLDSWERDYVKLFEDVLTGSR
jgi:glycosyltransferase involved in cell wall biosynthesis